MQGSRANDHASVAEAQPWFTKTFITRVMRSTALQNGGRLDILTSSAHITGSPTNATELSALWNRARHQIMKERHEPDSRIPEISGGDILELEDVIVRPFADADSELYLDRIVLFTEEIVGIHVLSARSLESEAGTSTRRKRVADTLIPTHSA